jgi:hypothetical protein
MAKLISSQLEGNVAAPLDVYLVTDGLGDGRKTVGAAGTAEALASTTACKWVIVMAETNNTGVISVGAATTVAAEATRRGIPLAAGESVTVTIDDLAAVYLDTTVNGDGVTYLYGT